MIFLGFIFHLIGGFASGSFYIPYKKVKGWSWESYWIVGGLFSWLIVPFISAWLTIPNFLSVIANIDASTLFITYFLGAMWGVGGLTFGLAMRYLGMSLGMSVALGFCSAFGALIPAIYADLVLPNSPQGLGHMLNDKGGIIVLFGVVVCLIGIVVCGKAGMQKETELSDQQKRAGIKEFNLRKGLLVAVFSGILSSCMSFAISSGQGIAEAAERAGADPLFSNNATFIVVMLGGLTTNFIWCMILNARNRSFGDYSNKGVPLANNYIFAALAGTTWFMQYFFYGMGESKLGNGASSWILHMAFIILVSNMWGFLFKEWKGVSKKTYAIILTGITLIIVSVVLVGYGNTI